MLRQTVKFAIRNFKKSKLIHSLNVLGLTLGLSVFFLASLYIYQENSYERDFSDRNRIYQISSVIPGIGDFAYSTPNLASISNEIPDLEGLTVFTPPTKFTWNTETDESFELTSISADENFLSIFDFSVRLGNKEQPISAPNHAAIFESAALRVFGTTDVIGRRLDSQKESVQIVSLLADPQYKTQLKSDLIKFENPLNDYQEANWNGNYKFVFAKTKASVGLAQLNETLERISFDRIKPIVLESAPSDFSLADWKNSPRYKGFKAEGIDDLRKSSNTQMSIMPKTNAKQSNAMIIVGLAALLISVINFVNLSTAKASVRHKEVGVKRILGSRKWLLILQFLFESFMLIGLSAVLALAAVEFYLNVDGSFSFNLVDYSVLQSSEWIISVVIFILLLSLIGGVYPALYLSSGSLINLTKKQSHSSGFSMANAQGFRKGATVVQFVCSIGLIFSIVVIFSQVNFLKNRDLGYSDEGIVSIRNLSLFQNLRDNTSTLNTFINEVERVPSVKSIGFSSRTPIDGVQYFPVPMKNAEGEEIKVTYMTADHNFFDLMRLEFLLGKPYESKSNTQENVNAKGVYIPAVINEMTVKTLGLDNPIGEIIDEPVRGIKYEVVGVVKDFFFESLREAIDPIIISRTGPNVQGELLIKTDDINETIAAIEPLFQKHIWTAYAGSPMVWNDLAWRYESLLSEETSAYKLLVAFSVIAVIISCIGLLGLSLFMIDQRIHEFGVRKVLGASVGNIMALFSYDVFKLILLSIFVALPLGSLIMREWLNDFDARINLSFFTFGTTTLLTLLIVFITISFQSWKAGRLNPVETLRNE
ncbi:FtsX-like permease family protein [Roseivirga misakiensis]|uniref:Uncharacterized protein n=1 Tax=Roseivirga misakiensis TaxID=1563681 RepID=A0A1E5SYJ6_9BACT|nr:FtsX-like permease family protein [Roseivirga misakiensis]OEK04185.1 hypothetical protein BFP71_11925 [Roseivirga misakiensis]